MKKKQLFFDEDASIKYLKNKKVGIIGYGNQGKAQALNLIDSNIDVLVGVRKKSPSILDIKKRKIKYDSISNVVKKTNVISMLVPDIKMPLIYKKYVKENLEEGDTLLFSHGYNIIYKGIVPPKNVNVIMVAPSGGGALVRDTYTSGSGVPTLLAIFQDYSGNSIDLVKSYSKAIGGMRICSFMSSFKEEVETDLFAEQVMLTGGIPKYIDKSLKVLLEAGYDPIVSWFVCYYELKTIVDLFHSRGIDFLYNAISDTARYGGLTKGDFLIDDNIESKIFPLLRALAKRKKFLPKSLISIFMICNLVSPKI